MYLTREVVGASYPDIGKEFGGRDHTTVLHACRKIEDSQHDDSVLRSTIQDLTHRLKQPR
jgi:chromosomal replication initiator protein